VISHISEGIDTKKRVGIYLADLTAAFDLLRKEKLVEIMIKKGIPSYPIKIVHAYLENRAGYTQIDEAKSCVECIKVGCVQGSVLNDIFCPYKLVSYPDNSYVIVHDGDTESLKATLTGKLKEHFKWLGEMGMICNMKKTETMIFDPQDILIQVDGEIIKLTKIMKVLGVLLDNQLSWKPYIQQLIGKI